MGELPSMPGNGDIRRRIAERRRRLLLESRDLKSGNAKHLRNSLGGVAYTGGLRGFSERLEQRQVLTREHVAEWLPVCRGEFSRAEYVDRIEKALELLRRDLRQLDDVRQPESTQDEATLERTSRILEGTMSLMNTTADRTDLDSQNQDMLSPSFTTLVRTVTNVEERRVLRADPENWFVERNELIVAADVAADYFVMVDLWKDLE